MEHVRLPRLAAPPFDGGDLVVEPPPALPPRVAVSVVARLMPVAMLVAAGGMIALYLRSGTGVARSPMFLFFPVMMLLSALGSAAYGTRDNRRSSDVEQGRRDYLRYLDALDETATRTAAAQHESLTWTHPDPRTLWTLTGGRRMWERRPGDVDFCHVRLGLSTSGLSTTLVEPEVSSSNHRDHVASEWLRRFLAHRSTVADLPLTVDLTAHRWIALGGDAAARSLARAIVCQLAVLHGPDHVRVVAIVDETGQRHWEWLKWLPHHQHPHAVDALGKARMAYRRLDDVDLVADSVHVVVLVDGGDVADVDPFAAHVTIVQIGDVAAVSARSVALTSTLCADLAGDLRLDALSPLQAEVCARGLAPFVTPAGSDAGVGHEGTGWAALNGVGDPAAIDPAVLWRPRAVSRRLRVAIGVTDSGAPVELDIKEAAHGGMGPHGLCVGSTGSGKSEFLRTLALGLIAMHPPEALNLVLVDFKGGATFLGFERLRHTAAVITNLSDEAHLVTRMRDALAGEMTRRQEVLRAAGNCANVGDYETARVAGAPIPRLPALLVIVDEFSELLSQQPDFAELFVAIGRVGRSLGMHLLLASQRLDEGRLRGLESHLSYRICLKTFSASESRAVLGTSDAYELPAVPGMAYLKSASGELTRFHTAFVSGRATVRTSTRGDGFVSLPTLFTAKACQVGENQPAAVAAAPRTVLASVLDRLSERGTPAHRVWSPPFTVSPTLDAVLHSAEVRMPLVIPIGLVDKPFEQRRELLIADLSGAGGNVAVVGGPRSGKSSALRTIVLALAVTHSPAQVRIYGLDFGGGSLSQTRALPHVGSVAGRHEPDLVRRIVAELRAVVHRREAELRRGAPDAAAVDSRDEVFLVIDGWATIRHEFEGLEDAITTVAAQGLSVGVHVVLSASRWTEIRPALKDLVGTRIELRLGDPTDSEMDRMRARLLVESPPGRGLTRGGFELVVALPRLDGRSSIVGLDAALNEAARSLQARHPDQSAPPVELLPTKVSHEAVVAAAPRPRSGTDLVVGLGEGELRPLAIDLAEQSHLLILGESGSGKTSTLRTMCREVMRANSVESGRLVVVDYRRTLLGVVETDHLAGYAMSHASAATQIGAVTRTLAARMPPEHVTQGQLRDRSWWSGPEIFVIVDDYDLVAGVTDNPLAPLIEMLPHARDVGLHVVLARRSGGAARAMFDPMLARLRELGCMGLMMSAGPEEGPLFGSVRPSPMPPGRGVVIRRGEQDQVVQIGWVDPP
jgi:DNA segregation ATPase FtsK/SpoIIIE, S-DNA-T family